MMMVLFLYPIRIVLQIGMVNNADWCLRFRDISVAVRHPAST
ncbi:Hypothetical protein GbCGDNIH9_8446 [Granulibacter bethesdensis]|uniref:Uncharacterized protein n=1 Tax=Granulibacter bethesdensis TaxID=364410 RepID=A0AAC9KBA1_9PROT|nr:Hypothetical protein GbCGDNIH9_8446 [Granulibacter bethesdensis]APH61610.1 Hypothetical protein GbCGDNIH8_8446 [Granulibacter bethesdensis]